MVEVDMSDIDAAIKTLKSEADAAHNEMIQAVERLNEKTLKSMRLLLIVTS